MSVLDKSMDSRKALCDIEKVLGFTPAKGTKALRNMQTSELSMAP